MKKTLKLKRETIRSESPNTWRNSPTEPTSHDFAGRSIPTTVTDGWVK